MAHLASHYGGSPDEISLEEIRDYFHWLRTHLHLHALVPSGALAENETLPAEEFITRFLRYVLPS